MKVLNINHLFLAGMMIFFISCREKFAYEKEQVAALQQRIGESRKLTGHDVLVLKSRRERITERYKFLQSHRRDSLPEEQRVMMANYHAITGVYDLYEQYYPVIEEQGKQADASVQELEKILGEDDPDRQAFEKAYSFAAEQTKAFEDLVNKYSKPVLEVELLYERLDNDIQAKIDSVKK